MRISTTFTLALGLVLALAWPVLADDGGFYLSGKIGVSRQKVHREFKVNETLTDGRYTMSARSIDLGRFSQSTVAGGLAIGYDFFPSFGWPVRLDIDFTARGYDNVDRRHDVTMTVRDGATGDTVTQTVPIEEHSEIGIHTVLANFYYDFHNSSGLTPFLGAGLGLAVLHGQLYNSYIGDYDSGLEGVMDYGDVQFAWALTGGVNYALTPDWSLDLSYRYTDAGNRSYTANLAAVGLETDMAIHDLLAGVRYTF